MSVPFQAIIDAPRRLDELSTARLIEKIADAVHKAQSQGQPLNTLSPAAIVVEPTGDPHLAAGRESLLAYSAPERVKGSAGDRRSDVFALGIVLWEALAHTRLFEGSSDDALKSAILEREIRPPSELNANVPAELDAICKKALARDPADRYQSAKVMAAEISAVLDDAGYPEDNAMIAKFVGELRQTSAATRTVLGMVPLDARPKSQTRPPELDRARANSGAPPVDPAGRPITPTGLGTIERAPAPPVERAKTPTGVPVRAKTPTGAPSTMTPEERAKATAGALASVATTPRDKSPTNQPLASASPATTTQPLGFERAKSSTNQPLTADAKPDPRATLLGTTAGALVSPAAAPASALPSWAVRPASGTQPPPSEARPLPGMTPAPAPAPVAASPAPPVDPAATLAGVPAAPGGEASTEEKAALAAVPWHDNTPQPARTLDTPASTPTVDDPRATMQGGPVTLPQDVPPVPAPPIVPATAKAPLPAPSRTRTPSSPPPNITTAETVQTPALAASAAPATPVEPSGSGAVKVPSPTTQLPEAAEAVALPRAQTKGDLLQGWGWGTDSHPALTHVDDGDDAHDVAAVRAKQQRRLLIAIGGALAAVLLIVAVAFAFRSEKKSDDKDKPKAAKTADQLMAGSASGSNDQAPAATPDAATAVTSTDDTSAEADKMAAAEAAKREADEAEKRKLEEEAKRAADEKAEADKRDAEKREAAAAEKREAEKREADRREADARKKEAAAAAAKLDAKKADAKKADTKKADAKKTDPKKKEVAKADTKKADTKKDASKIDAAAAYRTGLQQFARGDHNGALETFRTSLAQNQSHAPTWRGIGLVYEKLGMKAKAKIAFQKYLKLSPSAGDAEQIKERLERL